MRQNSLYFFRFLFHLGFQVSVESCNGSHRSSSFIPLFLSDAGASTSLFSDTESLFSNVVMKMVTRQMKAWLRKAR